ncbi:hypothetical protein ACSU64_28795 [Bacillaceae bacterium C204]|uniref:hypothetical protein n=1 Tax=Neobacillus sp. 204 TaxID=3383351 RepID=UPI00397BD5CC
MDKVTCIAYLLYKSSKNQDIREIAIELLNGDVSLRELKKIASIQTHVVIAESLLKKNQIDKDQVQLFAEQFMYLEV